MLPEKLHGFVVLCVDYFKMGTPTELMETNRQLLLTSPSSCRVAKEIKPCSFSPSCAVKARSFRFQRGARPRSKSKQGTRDKFLVYLDKLGKDEESEDEGKIDNPIGRTMA